MALRWTEILFSQTLRQLALYAGVGSIGTSAHYAILIGFIELLHTGVVVATTAGFMTGATINYVLNRRLTFRSEHHHSTAALRFFLVAGVSSIANTSMVTFGIVLGFHYLLAQAMSTIALLLASFFANKLWTFGR